MTASEDAEEDQEEPDDGSPAAGGCVIALGIGAPLAGVYAVSVKAGILVTWAVGIAALWRAARRPVPDSSAPPPPQEDRPSCSECAGHTLVSVTPSESQKGMLIYQSAAPDHPNHTHIHIQEAT